MTTKNRCFGFNGATARNACLPGDISRSLSSRDCSALDAQSMPLLSAPNRRQEASVAFACRRRYLRVGAAIPVALRNTEAVHNTGVYVRGAHLAAVVEHGHRSRSTIPAHGGIWSAFNAYPSRRIVPRVRWMPWVVLRVLAAPRFLVPRLCEIRWVSVGPHHLRHRRPFDKRHRAVRREPHRFGRTSRRLDDRSRLRVSARAQSPSRNAIPP